MKTQKEVTALLNAATDMERPFIEEAAERAGLIWKCKHRDLLPKGRQGPLCNHINLADEIKCGACNRPNPSKLIVELESPSKVPIRGTLEVVEGTALAEFFVKTDKGYDPVYSGDTEIDWNSQETKTKDGQKLYVDNDGTVWAESQLKEKS